MFSVLVISHGRLAEAMIEVVNMVSSCKISMNALTLDEEMEITATEKQVADKIEKQLLKGDVVVVTDFKIGTPFNLVMRLMRRYPVIHLTGANISLLLNLCYYGGQDLNTKKACELALEAAKNELMNMDDLMREAECGNCIG